MVKVIELKLYSFEELSEDAKKKAINWHTENNTNDLWYENLNYEFDKFLTSIGFENVESYFSLSYSQGDGACFDFKGLDIKKLKILSDFNSDFNNDQYINKFVVLHNEFVESNKTIINHYIKKSNYEDVAAVFYTVKNGYASRYNHSKTRSVIFESVINFNILELLEKQLDCFYRDLADTYYKLLVSAYEVEISDETATEFLTENDDYLFLENGDYYGFN